jgi:FkbM family methyltransferase
MRNYLIKSRSPARKLLPLVRKLRRWAWKFQDRTAQRLVISGGPVRLLDAELNFPEGVGLTYSTPLFWEGPDAYELTTSRAIALLAGRSKLFLDIGSNIGIYAVYVGVKCPAVKVLAFEPVPAIWEKNCAFHRANGLSERVVLKLALGDRDGAQKIFLPRLTSVEEEQTATLNAKSWQAHAEQVEVIEIQCQTLDSFAAKNPLPVGLCSVKIDVEGFEAAVLAGGKNFFKERRPWVVCELLPREEFDPASRTLTNNNAPALALIGELDYAAFAITPEGFFRMNAADFSRPRQLKDFLLVPREKIPGDILYLALEDVSNLFADRQGKY